MHLDGYLYEDYHDSRSLERKVIQHIVSVDTKTKSEKIEEVILQLSSS
jgi:hypothetical protein